VSFRDFLLINSFQKKNIKKLYLITEICETGELAKWIKKYGPIQEEKSKLIMKKIVDAISYLHKNGNYSFRNRKKKFLMSNA
jgi:serine/threonine protein kinase